MHRLWRKRHKQKVMGCRTCPWSPCGKGRASEARGPRPPHTRPDLEKRYGEGGPPRLLHPEVLGRARKAAQSGNSPARVPKAPAVCLHSRWLVAYRSHQAVFITHQ